ncbi:GMC family oxidoreductase [bacterium]|nr:GMC family oxidoreductase [bacterium]
MFSKYSLNILNHLAPVLLGDKLLNDHPLKREKFDFYLKTALSSLSPNMRFWFYLGLLIFNFRAILSFGTTFKFLNNSQKTRYVAIWHHSSWFMAYALFRPIAVLIYTAFYADPELSKKLGYEENRQKYAQKKDLTKAFYTLNSRTSEIETDICIIGSGAGGAVAAYELASKGYRVLVVEEGSYFSASYFNSHSTLDRNRTIYKDGGFYATLGAPMILLPTGQAVGGTTIINSGTCFRTPDAVLKEWNKKFDLPFTTKEMSPYFDKVEHILKIAPVSSQNLGGNNLMIDRGVKKMGLHGYPLVRNQSECVGSGECIFGCPRESKQSMEQSYLPLAAEKGAQILTKCKVIKIEKAYDKATHLEARLTDTGQKIKIKASKFIVAGGTLNSPLLLHKSGMGRTSRELGKNLTIHPTAKAIGLFPDIVDGFRGVPQGYYVDDFEGEGICFESVFFPPWLLATSLHQVGNAHYEIMKNYRHVGIFGFLVHDECTGTVKADLSGKPLVFYQLGQREKEMFIKGLKILAQMFFAAGAHTVFPSVKTRPVLTHPSQIEGMNSQNTRFSDFESAAFHPLGTCRMGVDPRSSVVDKNLKLHDMENVWVMDGSVFPTSLGVNPQVTIMAFVTRAAGLL